MQINFHCNSGAVISVTDTPSAVDSSADGILSAETGGLAEFLSNRPQFTQVSGDFHYGALNIKNVKNSGKSVSYCIWGRRATATEAREFVYYLTSNLASGVKVVSHAEKPLTKEKANGGLAFAGALADEVQISWLDGARQTEFRCDFVLNFEQSFLCDPRLAEPSASVLPVTSWIPFSWGKRYAKEDQVTFENVTNSTHLIFRTGAIVNTTAVFNNLTIEAKVNGTLTRLLTVFQSASYSVPLPQNSIIVPIDGSGVCMVSPTDTADWSVLQYPLRFSGTFAIPASEEVVVSCPAFNGWVRLGKAVL